MVRRRITWPEDATKYVWGFRGQGPTVLPTSSRLWNMSQRNTTYAVSSIRSREVPVVGSVSTGAGSGGQWWGTRAVQDGWDSTSEWQPLTSTISTTYLHCIPDSGTYIGCLLVVCPSWYMQTPQYTWVHLLHRQSNSQGARDLGSRPKVPRGCIAAGCFPRFGQKLKMDNSRMSVRCYPDRLPRRRRRRVPSRCHHTRSLLSPR